MSLAGRSPGPAQEPPLAPGLAQPPSRCCSQCRLGLALVVSRYDRGMQSLEKTPCYPYDPTDSVSNAHLKMLGGVSAESARANSMGPLKTVEGVMSQRILKWTSGSYHVTKWRVQSCDS
uniref:Uncharacterized protein n=1 Tax=Fusarium oxysporum (strain Fo5176) TaxID=660025 RepID=A0A0D2YHV1_FUSOF